MWYWIEIFGAAGAGLSIIGGLCWAGAWLSVSRRILERVPEKELSAYMQRRGKDFLLYWNKLACGNCGGAVA